MFVEYTLRTILNPEPGLSWSNLDNTVHVTVLKKNKTVNCVAFVKQTNTDLSLSRRCIVCIKNIQTRNCMAIEVMPAKRFIDGSIKASRSQSSSSSPTQKHLLQHSQRPSSTLQGMDFRMYSKTCSCNRPIPLVSPNSVYL